MMLSYRIPLTALLFFVMLSSCTFKFMRDDQTTPVAAPREESVGGATGPASDPAADRLQPGAIGPGDILQITVYGEKDLTGLYQVSPEGFIVFPFAGELAVSGMTNFSLAETIADKLRQGYLRDPQVHILVKEINSRRVFVFGQVKSAGRFTIIHEMSVVEAISIAGGFTNFADVNNVVVTRRDKGRTEVRYILNIDDILRGKRENFYLLPGDIVFVRERFF